VVLVVLGAPGAGKTHLFARLRQRLGPKAVFVHVRPLLNSEMTARFVLYEIAKQLG
jgi:predicted ATPase